MRGPDAAVTELGLVCALINGFSQVGACSRPTTRGRRLEPNENDLAKIGRTNARRLLRL
ncbi:hypothetical protein [Nonomuraea sp. NPDC003709]|uniref:hypothetical protein n=1 Tax=Nonomuraea sp. NPDC003709 TaxID=3154450 RepID=UPI0033B6AB84